MPYEFFSVLVGRRRVSAGSHVVLVKDGSIYSLSVPLHKELGPGLLRDLIRKSGLTIEEFIALQVRGTR